MTAPFTPPPSRAMLAVTAAMLAVAVAMPFGRRDDWLGSAAFLTVAAANIVIWGILLRDVVRRWREPPASD